MKKAFPMAMVTAPGVAKFREKVLDRLGNIDILIRVKATTFAYLHGQAPLGPHFPYDWPRTRRYGGESWRAGVPCSRR